MWKLALANLNVISEWRRISPAHCMVLFVLFAVSLFLPTAALGEPTQPGQVTPQLKGETPRLYLYTLGPGSNVFEAFGHAFLCFELKASSQCFDYGVFSEEGVSAVVFGTLRGEEKFKLQSISYESSVDLARLLDRAIWRQRIAAPQKDVNALYLELTQAAQLGATYAYHPATANCSTKLRDIIDELSEGQLTKEGAAPRGKLTYRERVMAALGGRVPELLAMECFLGSSVDVVPDSWDAAYEPESLRAFVEESLGAAPEIVHTPSQPRIALSPVAGRGLLMLLGAVLAFAVFISGRGRARLARFIIGGLGYLSSLLWAVMAWLYLSSPFPEFSSNFLLLALWPSDFLLAHLRAHQAQFYLRIRSAVLLLFLVGNLSGLATQIFAPACVFFLLPFMVYACFGRSSSASPF